jgi:hypothetical protein
MQNIYVQALMQWLFFFAILSIILVPAFLFRKIAIRNNKKGWMAFVLGLAIGGVALQIGRLPLYFLSKTDPGEYRGYVVILMLVIGFAIDIAAVKIYRRKVAG